MLTGATNASLTLTKRSNDQCGQLFGGGNECDWERNQYQRGADSERAAFRLRPQPTNQTVKQGSNAVFTVTAAGQLR